MYESPIINRYFFFSGSNGNFFGCDVILVYFEKIHMDSVMRWEVNHEENQPNLKVRLG